MGAAANTVASLLGKLKVDDPWVPPKPWESIPSEGGGTLRCSSNSQSSPGFYNVSSLSESSLLRLVMNAFQGVESALIAVYQLSALFCSESADRTFHRISSLWARSSSTHSLGNLLKSIGQFGCVVFLLHKFVEHFTHLNPNGDSGSEEISPEDSKESKKWPQDKFGVVNQAFVVAVKKILDSYISALNTIYASVSLRRALKNSDLGCLTNVGNSEITVLEVYLHTKGLRTQIEALGNMCQICDIAHSFSGSSFEDLITTANLEFTKFPRGATLLTFLYMQLKVVDPIHFTLLKFLFLQSFEPYYRFVRSWIYEGRISDPYREFVMECVEQVPASAQGKAGISIEFPSSTVRVRDGVTLPCFLEDFLIPLLRVGQQLQVLVKLLELCFNLCGCSNAQEEILPFLDNPLNDYPFFASPLTFHKETIEKIALARDKYYQRMRERVENIFSKVEFRSPQASPYATQHLFATNQGINLKHVDSLVDDGLVPVVMDKRHKQLPDNIVEDEACSTVDEFSDAEDLLASSDSSSVNSFPEQNDTEQIPNSRMQFQPSYLSPLSISFFAESSFHKPSESKLSYSIENIVSEVCEKTQNSCLRVDAYCDAHCEGTNEVASSLCPQFGEQRVSVNADTESLSDECDLRLQPVYVPDRVKVGSDDSTWFHMSSGLDVRNSNFGDPNAGMFHFSDTIFSRYALPETANNMLQQSDTNCVLPSSFYLQSCNTRYGLNFLSMNPSISKAYWINSSYKPGERSPNYKESFSCFDFTSVRDLHKVCEEKLASTPRCQLGFEHSILTDIPSDATIIASDNQGRRNCNDENSADEFISLDSKVYREAKTPCANSAGGSKWESLLACFGGNSYSIDRGYRTSSVAFFDMPLDYVIKKCLWEEILLQYQYVSKLTLKLLEEGFALKEHLLALRRFHFMELADWADLFIVSLWHHKWHVAELDKRILEIQGVLELSIQRSSCEGDNNKDRLYVYVKRDFLMPLSASANGICSFDFLGLGYRVDWPVSIILTPSALKIYSDIFNFLIQVKFAIFCLSNVWNSLKGLTQVTQQSCPSARLKLMLQHISVLTETRHQVNHFVSTLQQYVQSQLSHVSWCKFLKSLKHEQTCFLLIYEQFIGIVDDVFGVKDLMDFEAVHMEYLTESLHICFLSEETQAIANIIQIMLKCSVELRSCLIGCTLEVGPCGKESSEVPEIDISKVLEIKKTFTKNVKDLFLIYLKSPKHGEFGLSRFWDYLNYNDYYADDRGMQLRHVQWA